MNGSARGRSSPEPRDARLRDVSVVVFDWDGTLVDSAGRIVAAALAAIEALGLPAREPERIRSLIGLGLAESVEALFPDGGPELHGRFVEHYRAQWRGGNTGTSHPFEGAEEVVAGLHERGYRIAVATGKSRAGLDRELDATGLGEFIAASRCADEAPSKPDPGMLEDIMRTLGAGPREVVVVGDTEYDLRMAFAAGVASIGAAYGVHDRPRLLECAPLGLIEAITELPDWL